MKYIKNRYKLFIIILIFWFLMNLNFEFQTILFGVFVSLLVTVLTHNVLYDTNGFRYRNIKILKLLIYLLLLFVEIFKASFTYIINLISKTYEPVVIKVDLDLYDPVQIGIIANSITLTPGTISVDINGHTIYVLTLAKPGTPQEELEAPIHEKFERFFKD
jgi:multicomponent Na+:H+ antiporter subunit E